MKMMRFSVGKDGFHGAYWPAKVNSKCCILGQFGDNVDDPLARCGVKWFHDFGCNVMALSPGKNDYSFHDTPLETFGKAIDACRKLGNEKFGITGASTTGMASLLAASYYPEITLTIAFTPSDWVMEGYYRDGLDGCAERPGNGRESTFTWKGEPLPFLPFALRHPEHQHFMDRIAKEHGDRVRALEYFDMAEEKCPVTEEMKIKVENIKGHIVFVGARDDALWDTVKYIRRMEERLSFMPHECTYESLIYDHSTHFVFPEGLWRKFMPGIGTIMTKLMFRAARDYPKECRASRIDIDRRLSSVISEWVKA